MRYLRFLQYKLITPFSESKDKRIFKRILFIFLNMIDLLKELILDYWICNEFKYEIFKFIDIEFIDIMFRRKSLESHAEDRDSSLNKKCARCVHCALETDHWNESSDSY